MSFCQGKFKEFLTKLLMRYGLNAIRHPFHWPRGAGLTLLRNARRVAEVWMDEAAGLVGPGVRFRHHGLDEVRAPTFFRRNGLRLGLRRLRPQAPSSRHPARSWWPGPD